MKYLLLALLTSCVIWSPTSPKLTEHEHECIDQGRILIEQSKVEGLPCWATQVRLQRLVQTSPDCVAYWGDAGVDLRCEDDGGTNGID